MVDLNEVGDSFNSFVDSTENAAQSYDNMPSLFQFFCRFYKTGFTREQWKQVFSFNSFVDSAEGQGASSHGLAKVSILL